MRVRWSQAEARELVQALASLNVGTSGTEDIELLRRKFRRYEVSTKQTDDMRRVGFVITNQPLAMLKVQPIATLSVAIAARNDKVVWVEVELERQVGRVSRAAIVLESLKQSAFCEKPYCVGNPIGKPFTKSQFIFKLLPDVL